jgi:asparagine synthase (glutamine-hydrolysing)
VFFYGEGPDNALKFEWRPYLSYLARGRRWTRLIRDVLQHVIAHRRLLPMSTILSCGKRIAGGSQGPGFPLWLDDGFAARTDARARWETMQSPADPCHPVRPAGFQSFAEPIWPMLFESIDPGYTEAPVEFWHPYLDLRILRYMLSVPSLPWCRGKYLLRQSMQNMLPEEVLRRDKARWLGFRYLKPFGERLCSRWRPRGSFSGTWTRGRYPARCPVTSWDFGSTFGRLCLVIGCNFILYELDSQRERGEKQWF